MLYDLIIMGGGPAGITAGIYASRQRLNALLIAKDLGGQVAKKAVMIENYPGFEEISGPELVERFEKHLRKQKIKIEIDEVLKVEKTDNHFLVSTISGKKLKAKTVIIASGVNPRVLAVPGEKEFIGRGVSYCTTCDSPLFVDKTVAVVGGGNAGFEAALALSRWAKKIYILEQGAKVRADETNQEEVKKTDKIEVITSAGLKKIQGSQFVDSIVYQDKESGEEKVLSLQGVFVEIGSIPATSSLSNLVDFNERGEVKIDFETGQTKTPGLFAAGDVNVGKYKQIVIAAGEGARAALSAYDYLRKYGK